MRKEMKVTSGFLNFFFRIRYKVLIIFISFAASTTSINIYL